MPVTTSSKHSTGVVVDVDMVVVVVARTAGDIVGEVIGVIEGEAIGNAVGAAVGTSVDPVVGDTDDWLADGAREGSDVVM
jgi:hypothetical protein